MRISEYSVIEKPFKLSSRCMNLTGQKFGLLFAVKPLHLDRSGRVIWKCMCECGTFCEIHAGRLARGQTRSCGCLRKRGRIKGYVLKHGSAKLYQLGCRCQLCKTKHTSYWDVQMEKNYKELHTKLDEKLKLLGRTPPLKFDVQSHPRVLFLEGLK